MRPNTETKKDWGAVNIVAIVVILLVIFGVLYYLAPKITHTAYVASLDTVSANSDSKTSAPELFSHCGLTVEKPVADSYVSFPTKVEVTVDNTKSDTLGCSWTLFEGQAGVVKVIDQNGVQIAVSPLTTSEDWMTNGPVHFTAEFDLKNALSSGTLLMFQFVSEDPSGQGSETLTVPVVSA